MKEMRDHKKECLKICPTCSKSFKWENRYAAHLRGHIMTERRMVWLVYFLNIVLVSSLVSFTISS